MRASSCSLTSPRLYSSAASATSSVAPALCLQGTAFLRMQVFHQTIDLPPFVIFREILGNRHPSGFTNSRQWQYL